MKRFFAASIVAGAALMAGIGTADSQTILRGTRPAAPTAQQTAPLVCPDGSYNSDGLCRPYSWAAVTTGENELQFLYPLPPLER
jgi:hypothetical protein